VVPSRGHAAGLLCSAFGGTRIRAGLRLPRESGREGTGEGAGTGRVMYVQSRVRRVGVERLSGLGNGCSWAEDYWALTATFGS
jgi:hypothetical protein